MSVLTRSCYFPYVLFQNYNFDIVVNMNINILILHLVDCLF